MNRRTFMKGLGLASVSSCTYVKDKRETPLEFRIETANFDLPKGITAYPALLSEEEIRRKLEPELAKYPPSMISDHLSQLLVVRGNSLHCDGVRIGGLVDEKYPGQIILDEQILANPDTGFHHEFSSVLLRQHQERFPWEEWKSATPDNFRYGADHKAGSPIAACSVCFSKDPGLNEKGFVCEYGQVDIEEDINTLAHALFARTPEMMSMKREYGRIGKKIESIILFYDKINGNNFFRDQFKS